MNKDSAAVAMIAKRALDFFFQVEDPSSIVNAGIRLFSVPSSDHGFKE
jgi:hypothetical protein